MAEAPPRLIAALADRYRIERELGEGGMATVYYAEDLKHRRKVAVKVLRPELAAVIGAERFLQEIEVTANLQHPHILPLHDSGEADSFLFYVMPFVEGETLRDRMSREKQLPVDETVEMARAVAGALDYAHRQGVIHRDIKPENILIHDGQALVADFGISLAATQAGGNRMTETGLSLGTPHYMSPEQATGERAVDARSDIYSLGCVTYEMLTGDPPHTASTVQAIVAKVLTETPSPITRTRTMVPPNVAAAVERALAKTPADRFATAAEFSAALADPNYRLPAAAGAGGESAGKHGLWNPVSIGASVLAVAFLATTLWGAFGGAEEPPVNRQRILLWETAAPLNYVGLSTGISPDGQTIVYADTVGGLKLWSKSRTQEEPTVIPGTDGAISATFSPDGQWLAFVSDGKLKKVPAAGGSAIALVDTANTNWPALAWFDDGTMIYNNQSFSLRRVADAGGTSTAIDLEQGGRGVVALSPLPQARGAIVTMCTSGCGQVGIWVLDLRTNELKPLLDDAVKGWYLPSGHLLYARVDGGVFAAAFDLENLVLSGAAIPVLDGVRVAFGSPDLALSLSGTMLYVKGTATGGGDAFSPAWVERDGTSSLVDPSWRMTAGANGGMAISPDGSRLAINVRGDESSDIWIKQLDRGPLSRLSFEGRTNFRPNWTPDGRSVTYLSNRGDSTNSYDFYTQRADGSGKPEMLLNLDESITEGFHSPDGEWYILRTGGLAGVTGNRVIVGLRPGKDSSVVPLVADDRYDAKVAAISPDGLWLAYESDESGREEIYVRPFPNTDNAKVQISTAGGTAPLWSRRGDEIFFLNGSLELVSAAVTRGSGLEVKELKTLFPTSGRFNSAGNSRYYDVAPGDQRFLFLQQITTTGTTNATPDPLILVENWFSELNPLLKSRAP
jgi:serine/threonine-protein kinase